VQSRWASFENPKRGKGAGGWENKGAKGHPYETFPAGDVKTLLDVEGHAGIVQRIWITIPDRDPKTLRSLRLDMYWDGEEKPAVSVPLGDFFGHTHGDMSAFENALFSSPEGRSFNCFIPMPFRDGARITVTNEGERVRMFFYDVEYSLVDRLPADALYFHAYWHRENPTTLEKDFAFLPRVEGRGRFLGVHFGVYTNPRDTGWWGEGEVKAYLDGDGDLPTIVGTGTEDYIGTGWGQGEYVNRTQGCWTADEKGGRFAMYRYHLDAPIYFHTGARVTIQQLGGSFHEDVLAMMDAGVPIKPVTIGNTKLYQLRKLLDEDPPADLRDPALARSWTNYWRQDDVCATALFYLDRPSSALPALQPVAERIADLREATKEDDAKGPGE
jgi:hypothetical protein